MNRANPENSSPQSDERDDYILHVSGLSLSYDGKTVLDNVHLSVKGNRVFALVGANGAGKTTLIKAITGLREQDKGDVIILGALADDKETRAQIAYLPELFQPPGFLTGLEFIKFTLSLYDQPLVREKLLETASLVSLSDAELNSRTGTYSKGMRQKLGLIAIMLTKAKIMILDEPMSGLDPFARVAVKKLIAKVVEDGKTVFFSSHILSDVDEMCDEMALVSSRVKGVAFQGTANDLKTKTGAKNLEEAFLKIDQPIDIQA